MYANYVYILLNILRLGIVQHERYYVTNLCNHESQEASVGLNTYVVNHIIITEQLEGYYNLTDPEHTRSTGNLIIRHWYINKLVTSFKINSARGML